MSASLLADLTQHGFFEGLSGPALRMLQQDVRDRGWPAIFEESHRVHWVNPAALASGGVGGWLMTLAPFLKTRGAWLHDIEDDIGEDAYVVRIDSNAYWLYDADEVRRERSAGQRGLLAGLCLARTFRFLNELLEDVGSPERLYAVSDGVAVQGIFLTPQLLRIINTDEEASPETIPYVPDEEYPLFGRTAS